MIGYRINPVQDGCMYLRKSKKPNGRTYLTIVQGYRDADGKNRARTVRSLGYVDALEAEFPDPVAHFEEECRRMTAEAARAGAPIAVEFAADRKIDKRADGRVELGAAVPSAYFHRDLGIWSFFERRRTARGFAFDPCRVLELLVWDRIAHPSSKLAAWQARGRFPRRCDFTADDVYRCLTYLDANADALVKHMNASLEASRGPRDRTTLYYDVTNCYFECEEEDGFRMRGVSKEHRPNPIVQMGLFLDAGGLPMDYRLFPGNANDMTTLLPAMEKAGVRGLPWGGRVVVVADKGLNTSKNIAACVLDGNGYIFSQSVRKATGELKAWVLDEAGYEGGASGSFKLKSRISEKAVYVAGEDGRRRKVMVPVKEVAFWSRDYFERSRHERAKVVEKSRAAVARGDMASAAARTSARYAKDVPVVRETGERADHNWVVDEGRIAADEAMDGYYCIVTSEQEMADRDVIDAYRGLWRIEETFRVMKGDLDARPVYCSTESHIRAHFLVCYVALLVMRLMQLDTGRRHSAAEISSDLSQAVGHPMPRGLYLFDYRTDLLDELSAAVGVDLSRQVLTRGQIRSIMADVKKPRT